MYFISLTADSNNNPLNSVKKLYVGLIFQNVRCTFQHFIFFFLFKKIYDPKITYQRTLT